MAQRAASQHSLVEALVAPRPVKGGGSLPQIGYRLAETGIAYSWEKTLFSIQGKRAQDSRFYPPGGVWHD